MSRMIRTAIYATVLGMLMSSAVGAVTAKTWRIASAQDVERGNIEGLSVGDDGTLTLAPALDDLGETEELFVWALAEDASGNIYAATGNQGRLFVIERDQAPRLLFDSPQTQLQSVVVGPDGSIYTGSVPDGIIYKVTPQGNAEVFVHTGEMYIWDLAFNADGYLYAATGTSGIVLKIDRGGIVEKKVLDSRDRHVMALVPDGHGGFYAGTEGSGLVYHIDAEDNARLLFSAAESEVHTMTLGPDGRLYVGAVNSLSAQQQKQQQQQQANNSEPQRRSTGSVYRLEPSGAGVKVWETPYPLVLSMAPYDTTGVVIGVGPRGVLYGLDTNGRVRRIADLGESQPTSMIRTRNGSLIIGMGNSGKVKRLGSEPGFRGAFTSDVYDGGLVSEWGRVELFATASGTEIAVESRTGNTSDPEHDWSYWRPLGGPENLTIVSPPGRFVQIRVTLSRSEKHPAPSLHSISFASQQVNVPPRIVGIKVTPYAESGPRPPSENREEEETARAVRPTTREAVRRSIIAVRWSANDPNDDNLVYTLSYRRVGESTWKLLEQDITRPFYLWDTEGAPEGLTVVKLEASDRPSNPWPTAQTDVRISDPFLIDYTGPVIENLRAEVRPDGAVHVTGIGRDAVSALRRGSYAIDSGEWLVFFPADGIFDAPTERIDFVTERLAPGGHTIVVRLVDAKDNVGAESLTVDVAANSR